MKQTSKDQFWIDESGTQIPYNRTSTVERIKEKAATRIEKMATAANAALISLKATVNEEVEKITDAMTTENKTKIDSKGNFTWYNFDKTIKIETNINELIKFDEALLEAAKQILMQMIDINLTGDDFIKGIVADAFKTSKGNLDTKRILSLKRHTSRITNKAIKEDWQKAMELIDKAISRPDSKKYTRVYVKNSEGKYDNIELNFSSIKSS